MSRRYSQVKNIDKPVQDRAALPTTNNVIGERKFVTSEQAIYQWDGTKWVDTQLDFDLTIAPEVLEIQVDSPGAGQDTDWLWTWEQSTLPYARRTITNSPEVSVPLYRDGTYTINNYAKSIHASMTQAHSLFLKWIEGAGSDNLISWSVDQGTFTGSHPSINGGANTTVQRLSVSVPSTITTPTLTAPTGVTYNISFVNPGAYTFSGAAAGDNVNLGPLYRGGTYTFSVSASGHPFYLTTDNGTNFSSATYFGEYTSGVTNSRTQSGNLTFTVPANAPDTLYYQCGNHSAMRGAITIKDLSVETNNNGNYIVYAQHGQEGHKTPIELRPLPSLVNQMCLVYDASANNFVPQDMATYVENTPTFENKIREVAGTAELVVADGTTVVTSVNVYDDSTYLPLVGNNTGDQAFATDVNTLYIWDGTAWQQAGVNDISDLTDTTNTIPDDISDLTDTSGLLGGEKVVSLFQDGSLTTVTGNARWYADSNVSINRIVARVDTAPTGADLGLTVNKTGTSNATISLAVVDGTVKTSNTNPSLSLLEDEYLTVDVTQVGSTVPGENLKISFFYS
jgi:hypothetical protein